MLLLTIHFNTLFIFKECVSIAMKSEKRNLMHGAGNGEKQNKSNRLEVLTDLLWILLQSASVSVNCSLSAVKSRETCLNMLLYQDSHVLFQRVSTYKFSSISVIG